MASVLVALRSWRWALDVARPVDGLPCSLHTPPLSPPPPPPIWFLAFRRRPGRWNENVNFVVVVEVVAVVVVAPVVVVFDDGRCGLASVLFYGICVSTVSGGSENFLKRGGRKTIYQLRPRLLQMRTTKYMPFTRKKSGFLEKK